MNTLINHQQAYKQLLELDRQFYQTFWNPKLQQLDQQVYRDNEYQNKIEQNKETEYVKFIKNNMEFKYLSPQQLDLLLEFQKIFSISKYYDQIMKKERKYDIFKDTKYLQKYGILTRSEYYQQQAKTQIKKRVIDKSINKYKTKIAKELQTDGLSENYLHCFVKMQNVYRNNSKDICKELAKKEGEICYILSNKISVPYICQKVVNDGQYFKLQEQYTVNMNSGYFLWRIAMIFVRSYAYTLLVAKKIFRLFYRSRFGVLALFSCSKYSTQLHFDQFTGQFVYNRSKKTNSCMGYFIKACKKFVQNMQKFEQTYDSWFFPIFLARIFKILFEIFKLMIKFFEQIILRPIVCVIVLIVLMVLGLSVWIYVPCGMVLYYVGNILVYDSISERRESEKYLGKKFPKWVPIFKIIFIQIVVYSLFLLIGMIIATVILVIAAVLLSVFAILVLIFRYIYDHVMYLIIKGWARYPRNDSFLAWKVYQPNSYGKQTGQQYRLSSKDILFEVKFFLERQEAKLYQSLVYKWLHDNLDKTKEFNRLVSRINRNIRLLEDVQLNEDIDQVLRQTSSEVLKRFSRKGSIYGSGKMIRQMEQEYEDNIRTVEEYLRSYVKQKGTYLFEDVFQINLYNYEWLVQKVLKKVFGIQFMIPIKNEPLVGDLQDDEELLAKKDKKQRVDYSLKQVNQDIVDQLEFKQSWLANDIEVVSKCYRFYSFNEMMECLDRVGNVKDMFDSLSHCVYFQNREAVDWLG